MKRILAIIAVIILVVFTLVFKTNKEEREDTTQKSQVDESDIVTQNEEVVYVQQFLPESNGWNAVPAYLDEYSSLVMKTDNTIQEAIAKKNMYLGTILGYQNEDKTIFTYQIEIAQPNILITNDDFEFDYSGNSKMIEQTGYIYLDGTKIVAVAPIYK